MTEQNKAADSLETKLPNDAVALSENVASDELIDVPIKFDKKTYNVIERLALINGVSEEHLILQVLNNTLKVNTFSVSIHLTDELHQLFNDYRQYFNIGADAIINDCVQNAINKMQEQLSEISPKIKRALSIPAEQATLPFTKWTPVLLDRATCETDEAYVQIIPYIVFQDHERNVLTYTRGGGGNEARLHDKLSIGIGGHIESSHLEFYEGIKDYFSDDERMLIAIVDAIVSTAKIEAFEEVGYVLDDEVFSAIAHEIKQTSHVKNIYLKESNNPVDKYHVCVPIFITVTKEQFTKFENGVITNAQWLSPSELKRIANGEVANKVLENWSIELVNSSLI